MSLWSLYCAYASDVARIPSNWAVPSEVDTSLKQCTPCEDGKYVVDKSTPEQVKEQTERQQQILTEAATRLGVVQAECDQAGRNKYCYICQTLKPDRAHHCSCCGRCVVKYDHHCPWINQCVNYNNYKAFLLYNFYSILFVVWLLITSVECFVRFVVNANWLEDAVPLTILLAAATVNGIFGYFPMGEMLIFHCWLLSINETTCEQVKPPILKLVKD